MSTEDGVGGTHISWMVPLVAKGERLDVFMEIKGSGQIDAEALNRFHGVHFGDEVESDDLPAQESEEEEAPDEEEATEEAVAEEASEDEASEEEEAPKVTWREDVLLRVMEAKGISSDDRDDFVKHAANFDLDDNGYLKKAELEAAADAWGSEGEAEEEAEAEEDAAEEAPAQEEPSDGEEQQCPICSTMSPANALTCATCGFAYTEL
jgi:hypothetical protein